jgi:hypothetical protein
MQKWIDESRQLLIEILRRDEAQILHIWFNIYDNVYEQLDSSMTKSMCLELLRAPPTNHKDIDPCLTLSNLISSFEISIPHPESLKSLSNADLCVEDLAQTQVKKYGPVSAGKHRKSLEHGSSIPAGNFLDFSRSFPTSSCRKAQEIGRSLPEKIRTIFGRNTASMFRQFPAFSCRIQ